jgi:hypothetical protein
MKLESLTGDKMQTPVLGPPEMPQNLYAWGYKQVCSKIFVYTAARYHQQESLWIRNCQKWRAYWSNQWEPRTEKDSHCPFTISALFLSVSGCSFVLMFLSLLLCRIRCSLFHITPPGLCYLPHRMHHSSRISTQRTSLFTLMQIRSGIRHIKLWFVWWQLTPRAEHPVTLHVVQWLLYMSPTAAFSKSAFWPQNAFMFLIRLLDKLTRNPRSILKEKHLMRPPCIHVCTSVCLSRFFFFFENY